MCLKMVHYVAPLSPFIAQVTELTFIQVTLCKKGGGGWGEGRHANAFILYLY